MAMARLWAKKLICREKAWAEVPESRRKDVKAVLRTNLETGKITMQEYEEITGEKLEA